MSSPGPCRERGCRSRRLAAACLVKIWQVKSPSLGRQREREALHFEPLLENTLSSHLVCVLISFLSFRLVQPRLRCYRLLRKQKWGWLPVAHQFRIKSGKHLPGRHSQTHHSLARLKSRSSMRSTMRLVLLRRLTGLRLTQEGRFLSPQLKLANRGLHQVRMPGVDRDISRLGTDQVMLFGKTQAHLSKTSTALWPCHADS